MIVYATADDLLEGWLGEAPADAAMLLRQASLLVGDATRFDEYDVDDDEMPTNAKIRAALRDATCQQVASWKAAKVNPLAGVVGQDRLISSQSVDGASVSYTNLATRDDVVRATSELCAASRMILQQSGLGSRTPRYL